MQPQARTEMGAVCWEATAIQPTQAFRASYNQASKVSPLLGMFPCGYGVHR